VDGREFFSVHQDSLQQQFIQAERSRLIQKMLQAKQNGEPTQPVQIRFQQQYDCDTELSGSQAGKREQ